MGLTPLLTKFNTLLVVLAGSLLPAAAQIVVPTAFVHLDDSRRLLLINAPLASLQPTTDSLRQLVCGGRTYTFERALARPSAARGYRATAGEEQYTVYFTRLPVLRFVTHAPIVDDPSVYARMVLADTTGVVAQSGMGIQFRGAYTQSLPKKSYELDLWADTTGASSQNLALLGMRNDDHWNLQAMYNDPLRLRQKVSNELWQAINQPYYQAQEPTAKTSVAYTYVEVFHNGSYQGVYALSERVDKKQLQLKKYNTTIQGELYKGVSWDSAVVYRAAPPFDNASTTWSGFEYKEPSQLTDWTNLHDFVSFVVNSPDSAFQREFPHRFNQASAVDYFLFMNLLRAIDNTGKNLYVAKYKSGEPYFFVPWDLDGVLGNDWTGSNQNITNDILLNGLYERLQRDRRADGFWAAAVSRWAALRATLLTQDKLMARINACQATLQHNAAYEREHLAWPDYQYDPQQLTYPATWLAARLAYLDVVFNYHPLATTRTSSAGPLELYPNPASGYLYVQTAAPSAQLVIQDVSGRTVLQAALPSGPTRLDVSSLAPGLYLARVSNASGFTVKKLVVQ